MKGECLISDYRSVVVVVWEGDCPRSSVDDTCVYGGQGGVPDHRSVTSASTRGRCLKLSVGDFVVVGEGNCLRSSVYDICV